MTKFKPISVRRTLSTLCVSVTTLIAIPATAVTLTPEATPAQTVLANAVNDFIRPGYSALHEAADRLEKQISPLCQAPSASSLDTARSAFADLVTAWSQIEIIRFGPVVDDNRLERILFFPDRRGIGLKQVQAVLATKDETATARETLARKSVALQGLTTLEYLLYGTGAEELASNDTFRCAFADAVAGRLETVSGQLEAEWNKPDGIAQRLLNPDEKNPDYRTEAESLQALLSVFVNSSELIADTRLKPFVGESAAAAKPKRALFWRSGLTGQSISANLEGLENFYRASKIEQLLPETITRFGQSALFEMDNARQTIAAINQPLADAAANAASHGSVNFLRIAILSIRDTFSGRIAAGLGLSAGFSSLDGD